MRRLEASLRRDVRRLELEARYEEAWTRERGQPQLYRS